jgi:hypothetical protein
MRGRSQSKASEVKASQFLLLFGTVVGFPAPNAPLRVLNLSSLKVPGPTRSLPWLREFAIAFSNCDEKGAHGPTTRFSRTTTSSAYWQVADPGWMIRAADPTEPADPSRDDLVKSPKRGRQTRPAMTSRSDNAKTRADPSRMTW